MEQGVVEWCLLWRKAYQGKESGPGGKPIFIGMLAGLGAGDGDAGPGRRFWNLFSPKVGQCAEKSWLGRQKKRVKNRCRKSFTLAK